jgi:thioredoxin reductase
MKKTSIVIAGGGFAGLSAAMYLDKTLARRGISDSAVTMKTRRAQLTPIAAPSPPRTRDSRSTQMNANLIK